MDGTERDELEQALLALGDRAMVLEELDGFIAGILVCPELIPAGEWFAAALGLSKTLPSPFKDLDHANHVLGLVMDYYNDVLTTLIQHPENYEPLFPIDEVSGDAIWELWIDGFAAAVDLRPQAWKQLTDVGEEVLVAMAGLLMLMHIADGESDLAEQSVADMSSRAPDLIRQSIVTLHEHRLAASRSSASFTEATNPFAGAPKIGRNDPCPCGSGRKYKRCCGSN